MGYCGRCGDVVPGEQPRCRCGGVARAAKSSTVLNDGRPVTPEGSDAWSRRYVQRSPGGSAKSKSSSVANNNDGNKERKSQTGAIDGPSTSDSRPAMPTRKHSKHLKLPMMSPRLEDVEETITRAFGSVLDPQSKRAKWACAACSIMFVRDQTVYPDPRSKEDPSLADTLYCPGCFADRFSLGDCVDCGASVLPDAAFPFIQRKDKLWHAMCYACLYCSKDLSKSPQVDLYGNPCCSRCFDTAAFLKSPTIERVPALLSANDPAPPKPNALEQAKLRRQEKLLGPAAVKLGPAVNELRNRLEKAGFESPAKTVGGALPVPAPATKDSTVPKEQRNSWKMPVADKLERSQPVANNATSATVAMPTNSFLSTEASIGHRAPVRPLLGNRTTSFVPPRQVETIGKQSIPAPILEGKLAPDGPIAPPMLRSLSDVPTHQSKPSQAPASWQRHRLTRSVAGLPNPNTILSPPVATAKAAPPPSPVLAQIARFETASAQGGPAAGGAVGWKRPERTGRSQSLFAVPTLTQLKEGPSSRPLVGPAGGAQSKSARRGLPSPPVPEQAVTTRASVRPSSEDKLPMAEKAAASKSYPPSKPSTSESIQASSLLSADSRCSGCQLRLFSIGDITASENSKIITLPSTGEQYHSRCFVCGACKKAFDDGVFVELDDGKKVHEKCAPPLQAAFTTTISSPMEAGSKPEPSRPKFEGQKVFRSSPSVTALQKQQSAVQVTPLSPSKIQIKVKPTAGPTKLSKASEVFAGGRPSSANQNLGGMYICAGCGENATMAETTLGPVGTRFHHRCLKCSCGKKLDSGAKSLEVPDETGETRRRFACRDCIDKDRLAKRSLSSVTGLNALRGRI